MGSVNWRLRYNQLEAACAKILDTTWAIWLDRFLNCPFNESVRAFISCMDTHCTSVAHTKKITQNRQSGTWICYYRHNRAKFHNSRITIANTIISHDQFTPYTYTYMPMHLYVVIVIWTNAHTSPLQSGVTVDQLAGKTSFSGWSNIIGSKFSIANRVLWTYSLEGRCEFVGVFNV